MALKEIDARLNLMELIYWEFFSSSSRESIFGRLAEFDVDELSNIRRELSLIAWQRESVISVRSEVAN